MTNYTSVAKAVLGGQMRGNVLSLERKKQPSWVLVKDGYDFTQGRFSNYLADKG